jgi:pimeloyl-ACP methyl ester carboxylesterase
MKTLCALVALALLPPFAAAAQTSAARYGSNPAAGQYFTHDGVKLYYESYGSGEPLLLIHGNGGDIFTLSAQIDYFRQKYKVIAMDSRDQGRSSDSPGKITYEKMTDDLNALLEHLNTGPVLVLGWSDGGIEALLLAIRHPDKVKKVAAMAANLDPGPDAVSPQVIEMVKSMLASVPPAERNTPEGRREMKVAQMMLDEPHIQLKALEAIQVPTLILASDHDLIRDEHTLAIYHHIPNAQLAIFPDATHLIPYDDPARFNATVEHFFVTPYVKKDRVADALKSWEKLKSAESQPQSTR